MSAELLLRVFDRIADAPDAVPRLRRFVLELSVRGMLTDQLGGDGLAIDLLSQIEEERAASPQLGSWGRPRQFEPIDSDEEPFRVPETWLWLRLRQVTRDRGQTVPSSDFTYIDVTSIDKEAGRIRDPAVLRAADAPSRARKLVAKGDVLYSCVRPYLLNVAVVDIDIDPAPIASTAFAVLDGFGRCLPRYLWIVLRSPYFVEVVESQMRGQAYPAINDSALALLPIPVPPLAEQHRIIAQVDELMGLCDRLDIAQEERELQREVLRSASVHRLTADDVPEPADVRFFLDNSARLMTKPEHLAAARQTILDLAVRGRLSQQDPADESAANLVGRAGRLTDDSNVPAGWIKTRLGEIGEWRSGSTPSRSSPDLYGGPISWFKSGELRDNPALVGAQESITEKALAIGSFRMNHPGDVLLAMYGQGATIGKVAILAESAVTNQAVCACRPRAMTSRYLFYALMANRVEFRKAREGGPQPNISRVKIVGTPVLLPPRAEQQRIVAKVDELMAVCDELEAALAFAQQARGQLMESLLHDALVGSAERALAI